MACGACLPTPGLEFSTVSLQSLTGGYDEHDVRAVDVLALRRPLPPPPVTQVAVVDEVEVVLPHRHDAVGRERQVGDQLLASVVVVVDVDDCLVVFIFILKSLKVV